MKNKSDYILYIAIDENGDQGVNLHFYDSLNQIIGCIVTEGYNKSEYVYQLLEKINYIENGKVNEIEIRNRNGEESQIEIILSKEFCIFQNIYTTFESKKIKTPTFKDILSNFLNFLKKYENNEIPNLKYGLK